MLESRCAKCLNIMDPKWAPELPTIAGAAAIAEEEHLVWTCGCGAAAIGKAIVDCIKAYERRNGKSLRILEEMFK